MATTNQLLPVMRSDLIVRLLTRLLVGEVEENQRELATALGVSEPPMSAAAKAVCATGVVEVVQRGRAKYLRADPSSPIYQPMRDLITVAAGPAVLIGRALAHVPGVDRAYIFGSWAARQGRAAFRNDLSTGQSAPETTKPRSAPRSDRGFVREVHKFCEPLSGSHHRYW